MSDSYESSDKVADIKFRKLGFNVFEKQVTITSLTKISTSPYWRAFVEIELDELNLNTLVPEFSVTMHNAIVVDGPNPGDKIYYNEHHQLPINKPLLAGTIANFGLCGEFAEAYITYTSTGGVKSGVEQGTSKLVIVYTLRDWNEVPLDITFDVKIKGSDAATEN